jgi:hypothetical protein
MRMLPRSMSPGYAHRGSRKPKPSRRYGGYPLRRALRLNARYYAIHQVRRCRNPTHRQTLEGSLALGAIGKAVLVPASDESVLRQVASVEAYVAATPVLDRAEAPGLRVLGRHHANVEARPVPGLYSNGVMTDLAEAVKEIVRMVRPELTERQLGAAADVIASDIKKGGASDTESDRDAVAAAIAKATDDQSEQPSVDA